MSKPTVAVARAHRLLAAACLALALSSCHKVNQYDPTQDPALFPDARAAGAAVSPSDGSTGPSREADGPAATPEPSNPGAPASPGAPEPGMPGPPAPAAVCGTTCEAEKTDGCCPVGCTAASDI